MIYRACAWSVVFTGYSVLWLTPCPAASVLVIVNRACEERKIARPYQNFDVTGILHFSCSLLQALKIYVLCL